MNSFELNKVLGAILGTCLALLALNITAGAIFSVEKPAKPGYAIAVKETGQEKGTAEKKEVPIATLLAKASVDKGEAASKQCHACHTLTKGGPNRVGPNLWNIVDSGRGEGRGGFNFSSAMKSKGGTWTDDELNKFLAGPQQYIPGTKMTFAGVKDDQKRADLIAYLHTLSDNPKPLPKAAAAAPAGGEKKPAEGKPGAAPAPAAGGNKPAAAPAPAAKPPAAPAPPAPAAPKPPAAKPPAPPAPPAQPAPPPAPNGQQPPAPAPK
jgi:cytochrome c